jgi:hypothetical protein
MSYFAVTREPGPSWDRSRPMRAQDGWDAHARFMDRLVDDGFVVLGGPLGDGMRFLLIIDAGDVAKIDRWQILLERSTDGMEA